MRLLALALVPTSHPAVASFFDGGSAYNKAALLVAVIGLAATLPGLVYAILLVRKTRSAAVAAEKAASATAGKIDSIAAMVDISKLCRYSHELIVLLREQSFKTAAYRAFDLRIEIARFLASGSNRILLAPEEWKDLRKIVQTVEKVLAGDRIKENLAKCIDRVSAIHERFSGLEVEAARKTREV